MKKQMILVLSFLSVFFLVIGANATIQQNYEDAKNKATQDYKAAEIKLKQKYHENTPAIKRQYRAEKHKLDDTYKKTIQDYDVEKEKWEQSQTKKNIDSGEIKVKQSIPLSHLH